MSIPIRLLMVEDSEDDAELIRLELEGGGFELEWKRVETREDFTAALNEPWDLILSDYSMPTFDGLRAFELFQQQQMETPFVFVSGALGEERAVAAMRAGARDYLLKGDLRRLCAVVERELSEADAREQRRRAEATAQREQRRLALVVETTGAGVFEYSIPPDADQYFGERWLAIQGYSPQGLPQPGRVLEWIRSRVHPDDLDHFDRADRDLMAGRQERMEVEFRLLHEAGHWVEVAGFSRVVKRDADGRATHVIGAILDRSDHRKMEAQLRQSQKMEAVGRLAGGVAHDFNNLLTVILNCATFALETGPEDPELREDLEEILSASKKAEALTGQLLAFSRQRPISPKTLNANSVVSEVDRMLRRMVGEDINVSTSLAENLWNVRVDPGCLEQVLVNLAVNARDAMPEGGRLTLETENVELDEDYGRARGALVPAGEYVVLAVSDDGCGIAEKTQQKIFEPFFTTKGPGRGTGLGLSTCFGIVKQAGGYIWVYSEPDEGTTFKVYLPRVASEADQLQAPAAARLLGGSETILVVEDDDQVRSITTRVLSRLGYQILEAANGGEALELSAEFADTVHLLLTDVVMPGLSGKQLADQLAPLRPEMKVVYTSGYTSNAIAHRGVLEPDVQMLQKPFTARSLAAKVREVLDAG